VAGAGDRAGLTTRRAAAAPYDHEWEADMASDEDLLDRAGTVRRLLRAGPGPFDLAAVDPRATPGLPERGRGTRPKEWAAAQTNRLGTDLAGHQERLYASAVAAGDRRRVLLVLQAMDCGGKDGTIKSLVRALNPQGVRMTAFGPPNEEERGHHFLWRISQALPGAGQIGVFNRSHYEDVLAARVRSLVPAAVWRARYDEINRFEGELVADGLTIVKVMLHISAEEQRERLLARLDDPTKRWKFNPGDLDDRALWDDYQAAYAEAITRCATEAAPWYVVPADRKWYRNWAVANVLLAHFAELGLTYPEVEYDVAELSGRLERLREVAAPRRSTRKLVGATPESSALERTEG
jgi:PPK2 family polyphosphate:nucleotide phosphotransferase